MSDDLPASFFFLGGIISSSFTSLPCPLRDRGPLDSLIVSARFIIPTKRHALLFYSMSNVLLPLSKMARLSEN